jgi:hypothetical protein
VDKGGEAGIPPDHWERRGSGIDRAEVDEAIRIGASNTTGTGRLVSVSVPAFFWSKAGTELTGDWGTEDAGVDSIPESEAETGDEDSWS